MLVLVAVPHLEASAEVGDAVKDDVVAAEVNEHRHVALIAPHLQHPSHPSHTHSLAHTHSVRAHRHTHTNDQIKLNHPSPHSGEDLGAIFNNKAER